MVTPVGLVCLVSSFIMQLILRLARSFGSVSRWVSSVRNSVSFYLASCCHLSVLLPFWAESYGLSIFNSTRVGPRR
jgi:hypothetical protein